MASRIEDVVKHNLFIKGIINFILILNNDAETDTYNVSWFNDTVATTLQIASETGLHEIRKAHQNWLRAFY